jgi:ketosteroid isomerase-like protein
MTMAQEQETVDPEVLAATNQRLAAKVLDLLGSEDQFDLFADDIVVEFPYGPSLGMPDRFETKPVMVAYSRQLFKDLPGLTMRDRTFYSADGDPNTVFIEYISDVPTPGGNTYRQVYINKMQFRDGLLVHMKEFWDPKRILDARAGLYDLEPAS